VFFGAALGVGLQLQQETPPSKQPLRNQKMEVICGQLIFYVFRYELRIPRQVSRDLYQLDRDIG
jgi:hypothetical protein